MQILTRTPDRDFLTVIDKAPRRSVQPGEVTYVIESSSRLVYLGIGPTSHYSRPMTGPLSGMASVIVSQLAATKGISVNWLIRDWYIAPGALNANNQSPIEVIADIVHEKKALIQPTPDGNMAIIYRGQVLVGDFYRVEPDVRIVDQENMRSWNENPNPRDGYNRFLITDQESGAGRKWFEHTEIDGYRRYVDLYVVPWDDEYEPELQTSSYGIVMEPLGVQEEVLSQEIEIKNGSGRLNKPVYDIVSRVYGDVDLGDLRFLEDGEVMSDVSEQSMVVVTYRTRYFRWLVRGHSEENVQFYLEGEEVSA